MKFTKSLKDCTIFVGIDQSINSTGYYIKYPCEGEIAVDKGLIKPGSRREGARLKYIFDKITRLLEGFNGPEVSLCMEGYAYDYRKGRVFELGEVGGVVKLCCQILGINATPVPPTELKKFVTGRGSATKKKMMVFTGEKQDDMADAKGLAMIAEELVVRKATKRHQLEVISNCIKNNQTATTTKGDRGRQLKKLPRI